jgi:hypothetical protein
MKLDIFIGGVGLRRKWVRQNFGKMETGTGFGLKRLCGRLGDCLCGHSSRCE